ncbi:hypothetical protein FALCPG4_007416 [Fusarium falciforme]
MSHSSYTTPSSSSVVAQACQVQIRPSQRGSNRRIQQYPTHNQRPCLKNLTSSLSGLESPGLRWHIAS